MRGEYPGFAAYLLSARPARAGRQSKHEAGNGETKSRKYISESFTPPHGLTLPWGKSMLSSSTVVIQI